MTGNSKKAKGRGEDEPRRPALSASTFSRLAASARPPVRPSLLPFALLLLPSQQSALDSAGPQAGRIESLWWVMFAVLAAVWLIVMCFVAWAAFRRRRPFHGEVTDAPETRPDPAAERGKARYVLAGVGATVAILFTLLLSSFFTGRALYSVASEQNPLTVKVTGHQWWWEVEYEDPVPSRSVTTANEIHLPAGRPVRFRLSSSDVIHSFWVPNLHGKTDLIPGRETLTWLRADRPGTYRGQCGEFCGHQHAHMAFTVVVEPEAQYKDWYEAQLKPAPEPANEAQARGREVFLHAPCIMCHRIQGTPANGTVGPDLTHVASRSHIAAGTLPNARGHLAGWVVDSQKIKPGNRMPPNNLEPAELQTLLDYLQSLK